VFHSLLTSIVVLVEVFIFMPIYSRGTMS